MEQYRYAIEELVADETAAENKRLEQEAKDTEFATQKVGVNTLYCYNCEVQIGNTRLYLYEACEYDGLQMCATIAQLYLVMCYTL